MDDCVFCKIIKRDIPADIFYEDADSLAFLDAEPVNLGHTLIIPKKHFETIGDMGEKDLARLNLSLIKVGSALMKISDGLNIMQNNNRVAGQDVPHVHFHLIPRYAGDGHRFDWPKEKLTNEKNKAFLEKIKTFLK